MNGELVERTLEVDGARHRWLEAGDGPAVVLVHGIPASPAPWRDVIPELEGARVLAWEMLGYGLSHAQASGCDISVGAQAGYPRRRPRELGIARAALVGHDLGGGVIQIAALSCARSARCAPATRLRSRRCWRSFGSPPASSGARPTASRS